MKDDDADIVKSVLSGNTDDFGRLVEKYQYPAERWAFQRVGNLSDAEDIAQNAIVEAYFRLDTLREPRRFGSWLHTIVSNTSVSWLRRRRLHVTYEITTGIHERGSLLERYGRYQAPGPDHLLEQQEEASLLQDAINTLPPMYQRVIIMFYFELCPYRKIADSLDISVTAVRNILHRARQRLRKETEKNG